jgi:tetratricopeptide (TPR) repeat protein
MVDVRESSLEEIEEKLVGMNTDLNKIAYLESALKQGFGFEIKRFLWGELAELYSERKMFEKAAKAMANKAGMEISSLGKEEGYIFAAELYVKIGKVDDAEEMFVRAAREANVDGKARVKLARKNVYIVAAQDLESKGKRAGAVKFYEKLMKMNLEEVEKLGVKAKLLDMYNALGMFREARLLEGF